jgi:hypothetical protein
VDPERSRPTIKIGSGAARPAVASQPSICRRDVEGELPLDQFYGWYDLIVTVDEDQTFKYRLAGHAENGEDSFSDPAIGGLATLKA